MSGPERIREAEEEVLSTIESVCLRHERLLNEGLDEDAVVMYTRSNVHRLLAELDEKLDGVTILPSWRMAQRVVEEEDKNWETVKEIIHVCTIKSGKVRVDIYAEFRRREPKRPRRVEFMGILKEPRRA